MKTISKFTVIAICSALAVSPVGAQERLPGQIATPGESPNPQIDYSGFLKLSGEISEYRQSRLVNLEQFSQLSSQNGAIILDTRSASAFRQGHIDGAINLPFSDFTAEKLAQYLGDQDRPILIYCNNNFRDDVVPVVRKAAPLALNIPTFINLYGYGYQNIYELNDVVLISDPRVRWVRNNSET